MGEPLTCRECTAEKWNSRKKEDGSLRAKHTYLYMHDEHHCVVCVARLKQSRFSPFFADFNMYCARAGAFFSSMNTWMEYSINFYDFYLIWNRFLIFDTIRGHPFNIIGFSVRFVTFQVTCSRVFYLQDNGKSTAYDTFALFHFRVHFPSWMREPSFGCIHRRVLSVWNWCWKLWGWPGRHA